MKEQLVKEYIELAKEAGLNVDYPITAWGLEEGDYVRVQELLFEEERKDNTDLTFESFMKSEIKEAKEKIEEKKEFEKMVDNYMSEISDWHSKNVDQSLWQLDQSLAVKKHVKATQKNIKGKREQAAYVQAGRRFQKQLESKMKRPDVEVGVTGPIYDDDSNPTFYTHGK